MKKIVFLFVPIFLFSCAIIPVKERYEGIHNDFLRVYVRISQNDIPESTSDSDLLKMIIVSANNRYNSILNELIKMNEDKKEIFAALYSDKNSGKIAFTKENEICVEAFVDYPVSTEIISIYNNTFPPVIDLEEDGE